ncbi:MAG: HAMP domain-containing sensor histidine kinase, partial [Myxococcota bacterium]
GEGDDAMVVIETPEGRRRLLAFRTADDGPCAVVLVEARVPRPGLLQALVPTLLVTAVVIAIAFFAAGPIVRRIRRLTADVRAARRGEAPLVPDPRGDEIGELSRAFAEDRAALAARMEELEQRDAALTAYIANTTHDVMLPLTVLQGHLMALRSRLDAHAETRTVELALEESHYLASLVQNLSAAARLDAGLPETERRPVELGPLIERVVARHAPIAAQKQVELNHAAPSEALVVRGDLTLLEQAVSNLVHNAVRYNDAGGHVAVLLEGTRAGFALTVVDDGPGVSEAALAQLTKRRFRSDEARSRHPSGQGLGLAITNDVAERHGFTVAFDGPEEGGLRARLTGPLVDDPRAT